MRDSLNDEMVVHCVTAAPADRRIGKSETIPRWGGTSRLALGAVTFAMPMVASLLALIAIGTTGSPPPLLLGVVFGFFITHCLLTLFYIAFAGQNPRLRSRLRWQMALILAGPVTIPVYWYAHVWCAPRVGRGDTDFDVPGMDVREARKMDLAT